MPQRTAEQKAARALQRSEGLRYQDALNRVRAAAELPATAGPPQPAYILQPTPQEAAAGITAEELGVRALPADATPQQRAHAEAVWRPAEAEDPCRCSGTGCRHGRECEGEVEGRPCLGRLVHIDRRPGSLWGLTTWFDTYQCSVCCTWGTVVVTLPDIPWGEQRDTGGQRCTLVYDGVRHPNFPGDDEDEGDGLCRGCGGYALSGPLCDGCAHEEMIASGEGPEAECGECGFAGPDLSVPEHIYHCVC